MFQEAASVVCFDDGECIINISFPHRRGHGDVLISRPSTNKLATIGLIGEPIAAPSIYFICLSQLL